MTKAQKARILLPLTAALLLLAGALSTQYVAHVFHYPREFGAGLVDAGAVRIYPPWAFIGWYGRYARTYPDAFE
ncbi:MAG: conjugal transfer protein TraG, partial [Phenylobacterium zucineum]